MIREKLGLLFNSKKKQENFVQDNILYIEEKIKPQLIATEKAVQIFNHYVENIEQQTEIKEEIVYQTLDERKEYLDQIENQLVATFNQEISRYLPFFLPAKNLEEVESICNYLYDWTTSVLSHLGYHVGAEDELSDLAAEVNLLTKYGINPRSPLGYFNHYFIPFLNNIREVGNEILNEKKGVNAGIKGEKRLEEDIDMYNDVLKGLYNIRIEMEDTTVESDAIIVSSRGVFTIEAKNYAASGSYSIRVTKDGQWLKVFQNGDSEPMNNVGGQAQRHVAYKQRFLNQQLKERGIQTDYIPVHSIIVLANDNVRIENESDIPIMRTSQVYNHILKFEGNISEAIQNEIVSIFQENTKPPKPYPKRAYDLELKAALANVGPIMLYNTRLLATHQMFRLQVQMRSFEVLGKNYESTYMNSQNEIQFTQFVNGFPLKDTEKHSEFFNGGYLESGI